jgi:signal transduction histidine kinase
VCDHGGAVAVESTGSDGTTFKVILPVTPFSKSSLS